MRCIILTLFNYNSIEVLQHNKMNLVSLVASWSKWWFRDCDLVQVSPRLPLAQMVGGTPHEIIFSIRFGQTSASFWAKWLQIYYHSRKKNQDIWQFLQPGFKKYELCPLIQTLICGSAPLWLCLRPTEIGGTGPPLSHLPGDAVSQNAGWQPGPDAAAEGDPRWQSGDHHHRRQCFRLLSHPKEGQL